MTNEREANDEGRVTKKEREIRELANWEISKLVWVVGEKWRGSGEALEERGWRFKLWQSV